MNRGSLIEAERDIDGWMPVINTEWQIVWVHSCRAEKQLVLFGNKRYDTDVPLWQNIDDLLAHYERSIVQNTCRPDTILRNRNLPVEDSFGEKDQPSFNWELCYNQRSRRILDDQPTGILNISMPTNVA